MRLICLGTALLMLGCGACQQVAAHRQAFTEAQLAESKPGTAHIRLDIPKTMIDGWANQALSALPSVPFDLPGLGDLSRYVDRMGLDPRRMRVSVSKDEAARFDLDLDIKMGNRALFGLKLAAVAPVTYNKAKNRLEISLRADMFEKIAPRLDNDATDKLTQALLNPVPSALRRVLRPTAQQVARRGVEMLTREAYRIVRRSVLTPLGELGRFSVSMPDVPIAGLSLTSAADRWSVAARLPMAAAGLRSAGKAPSGNTLRMAVSTDALVALGNWAMGQGKIPSRYTREGKATDSGEFEAGFAWQSGQRPLKVNFWTAEVPQTGICLHATAGADPSLRLAKGKLEVGFQNGQIEAVTGPPLLSNALDLLGVSSRAFEFTKSVATKAEFKLGKNKQQVALRALSLSGDMVTFDLSVPGRPGS